jgi:hypothetical protein
LLLATKLAAGLAIPPNVADASSGGPDDIQSHGDIAPSSHRAIANRRSEMRTNLALAALLMVTAATSPVLAQPAQDKGGIPTETQRRMAHQGDQLPWDLVGLFGLLGLLGLRTRHPDDSYHPSNLE